MIWIVGILVRYYVEAIVTSIIIVLLFLYLESNKKPVKPVVKEQHHTINHISKINQLELLYQNLLSSKDEENWLKIEYTFMEANKGVGIFEIHPEKDRYTRLNIAANILVKHNIYPQDLKKTEVFVEEKASLNSRRIRRHWISIPKKIGYTVGTNGLGYASRKAKLRQIMDTKNEDLPRIGNNEEKKWGEANTCARLQKLHDFLIDQSNMSKNHSRKQVAFAHYVDDLNWLKKEYYSRSGCYFRWGSIKIDGVKQNE